MTDIDTVLNKLLDEARSADDPVKVLKSPDLKALYKQMGSIDPSERAEYGRKLNDAKNQLQQVVNERKSEIADKSITPIDTTAPFDKNSTLPPLLTADRGSVHPLMQEIAKVSNIFERMGFQTEESRELDDQFHMFESLNFPKDHPARDDYDTFMTKETDENGDALIAPAHTSTMQYRTLVKYKDNLEAGNPIAAIVPDRVFRNEDVDARHEHTFYQVEGIYVSRGVNAGMLIATLQKFLEEYYGKKLEVRVNPFYFPFTEPSFEFALSCPFCEGKDPNCKVCSGEGWIELLGCGMIHPNVLKHAGIDSNEYAGFAFGCGVDRLVMMKYGIEDVRYFHSGKLDFLRQF